VDLHNSRPVAFGIGLIGVLALGLGLSSQEKRFAINRISVPNDWSHRHLMFSNPAKLQDSVRVQQDARYGQQRDWRTAAGMVDTREESDSDKDSGFSALEPDGLRQHRSRSRMKRDWGVSLGAGATAGTGMFPAKFSFDINSANCGNAVTPDYVVFNTSLVSTATQAGIVAFDNLYTGCTGTVPNPYWAYKTTGTGDNCTNCAVVTSVVLSLDGSQVAFVGSSTSGSFLYILKPKAGEGTVGSPAQPTTSTTNASTYAACRTGSTSCLLSLPLGPGQDSNSAPFYNYGFDDLYVGDDNGSLYRFSGVFIGTPTKVTTGWPIVVHSGFKLTAAIFDQTSRNAYVGDANGRLSFVREIGSTVGACGSGSPPCLGSATVNAGNGNSIVDAPIVDSTTSKVFAFVGNDGGGNTGVFQAPLDLSSHVEANVGVSFGNTLYDGAFDNEYFASVGSGHLYVCGNLGSILGLSHNVALFRIGFNSAGTMNAGNDGNSLTLTASFPLVGPVPTCSPATEISSSASSDLLFLSVTGSGSQTGCGGNGCVMSFSLPTATPFTFPGAASRTLPASNGTGGIIIDNILTVPTGTSQVYFTPLGNSSATFPCGSPSVNGVGCGIQASQAGLN
jgi:hypothetical protein